MRVRVERLARLAMLVFQDPHNKIVMPLAVDPRAFSFDALSNEAAFFIASNRPFIVLKHSHIYPMEAQLAECVIENEACGFFTKPFPPITLFEDANCVTSSFIVFH